MSDLWTLHEKESSAKVRIFNIRRQLPLGFQSSWSLKRWSIFYVVLEGFLPLKMMKIVERPGVHGALGGGEGARGEGRREAGADGASFGTVFADVLLAVCSLFR